MTLWAPVVVKALRERRDSAGDGNRCPISEAPSLNCTVPLAPTGVTAATRSTARSVLAVGGTVTVVDVATTGGVTVTVRASDVDDANPAPPEYTAVMLWAPSDPNAYDRLADPSTTGTEHRCSRHPPSLNCTVPDAPAGATVAASCTAVPCRRRVGHAQRRRGDGPVLRSGRSPAGPRRH